MTKISQKLINVESNYVTAKYNESPEPQTRNPIYKRSVNVGCPFCHKKKGRVKNFKNLNCLYKHFQVHHPEEPNAKELVRKLAEFIITGVLL